MIANSPLKVFDMLIFNQCLGYIIAIAFDVVTECVCRDLTAINHTKNEYGWRQLDDGINNGCIQCLKDKKI